MKTDNHYEVAFEAYLRQRGAATLPIVEARRSYLDSDSVKSPDFLVVAADEARLVVDVKGRKFGGTTDKPRRIWQNWCLRDDVKSLESWTDHFGPGFRGILAFVYHLEPDIHLAPFTPDVFLFRGARYLVRGAEVSEYRMAMRTRSPRWATVHLATADFRAIIKPFSHFLSIPRVESPQFAPKVTELVTT